MEQLLCEAALPGVVVFGRVQSYPWWPGIVGRCPQNGEWKDRRDRRWVFFFNDCNGAWLRIRDMRPFTEWTKETMGDINNKNARFPRYRDQIAGAVVLAEEYMRAPEIARPMEEYSATLTFGAIDMTPPENPWWTRFPVGAPGPPASPAPGMPTADKPGDEKGASKRARSKRKRKGAGEKGGKRHRANGEVSSTDDDEGTDKEEGEDDKAVARLLLTLPLGSKGTFNNIAEWKASQKTVVNVEGSTLANGGSSSKKKNKKKHAPNGQSSESAAVADHKASIGKSSRSPKLANPAASNDIARRLSAPPTMSPSASPIVGSKRARTSDTAGPSRSSRRQRSSRAPVPSAATAALLTGATSRAETIGALLNRMASLEGHVQSLQVKVGPDGTGETGEDRTAAVLKTSVRSMVRVAKGFSRSRYNQGGALRASIAQLWPKPAVEEESGAQMQAREFTQALARTLASAAEHKKDN